MDFICDILYRFSYPNTIIIDLGSNFTSETFWDFCDRSTIDIKYVSVAHPRANDQVERENGKILDGLKKRLYEANNKKRRKMDFRVASRRLGLRTQPYKLTGHTPFFLVYGSEAILPADIMWQSS